MSGAAALPRDQKIVLAEAMYQQRVRRARGNLVDFVELCGRDEGGDHVDLHAIHRAWVWHVDYCWARGLHAMILAPFGSGKSSTLAVPISTWLLGRNPQARIKFVNNADEFAKQRVQSAKIVMSTPEYQDVFPGIRRGSKWTDHEVYVQRRGAAIDPSLHARGVNAIGVGGRADYLIFDDVCDQKNTETEAQRRRTKEFVRRTWLPRLDKPHGRAMYIGTAWHADDATADLMNDPLWCVLVQRVSADFERYDQEVWNAGDDYEAGVEAGILGA